MEERQREINKRIGERVMELRLELNLSQKELAESASTAKDVVSRLERGLAMPSVAKLSDLARAMKVDLGELFVLDDRQSSERQVVMQKIDARLRNRNVGDLEDVLRILEKIFAIRRRGEKTPTKF